MFLDEEFLDRKDIRRNFERAILKRLEQDVPPSLVNSLCSAMLQSVQTSKRTPATLEHETFFLLRMLVKGDKPQYALELARKVITDRPGDSSWHRLLFTKGLLNSLPPARIRFFLQEVTSRIQTRLKEQSKSGPETGSDSSTSSDSIVKVTTVKMLAQMISGAGFIDEGSGTDILIRLFAHSQHLDIRVAIVQSLTATLVTTKDEDVKEKIFDALETQVVPIVAALNERYPMTENDWALMENINELPDVYQAGSRAVAPLLEALLDASVRVPMAIAKAMIEHVLLPVAEMSAKNNFRWMRLFIGVNHFSLGGSRLPMLPVKLDLIKRLVNCHARLIPANLLHILGDAIIISLQPPLEVTAINRKVLESSKLRSSNAGRHWLSLLNNESFEALKVYGAPIGSLLIRPFTSDVPAGITHEQVLELVLKQAEVLVMKADDAFAEQHLLFTQFRPPFRRKKEVWQLWQRYGRRLVERIVAKIEGLRTAQWQCDKNRKPPVLQDTYELRLRLLTYPSLPWLPGHVDKLEVFATELQTEIDGLVRSKQPYHHKFQELKTVALKAWPTDYCYLACKLGSLNHMNEPEPDLADLLHIELADDMLQAAKVPKYASHAQDARNLLASWRGCNFEEVRMRALRTTRKLSQVRSGKMAWFIEDTDWRLDVRCA